MARSTAALPDFRTLEIEEFLEKYETVSSASRRDGPAAKCPIMTDIIIEGGRTLLGDQIVDTSLLIAGRRDPRNRLREGTQFARA